MIEKYLDINLCLDRAKERAQVTDNSKDEVILEMLEDSAGSTSVHPKVFRPLYVAARYIQQDISRQQLSEAGDVKFTGLIAVVDSLMAQQAGLDQRLNLVVPFGMAAVTSEAALVATKRNKRVQGTSNINLSVGF